MELMTQLKLFTMLAGGSLVGGEIAGYILKQKAARVKNKLANGHLISKGDILDILGDTGSILSKDIQLKEKYDFEGSIVFGATGAGKSTGFYIPNLLNPNLRGSIVVGDPTGELFNLTSWYQQNICGRKVLRFSPLEPEISEKYNLLSSCKSNDQVKELASSLLFNGCLSVELATGKRVNGAEWIQMSESLLCAALLYSKDLDYPYNNIEFAVQLLLTLNTKQLDKLFSSSNNFDVITQWNNFKMVQGADRTEASIKITLSSNMKLFTDERINKVGSISTFDFSTFRKEPTVLYLTYPEHKANYIAPFTAPFLSRMLDTFIEEFIKGCLPVHCYFDEFCNLGMLSNMNSKASTVRKREISLNICIQGLTQLYQVYGRDNGNTILNNLKTKMIFPSMSDIQALDYISQLCGETEIDMVSKNENKSGTSTSYSKTKIMMFNKADLRCLDDSQLLIVTSNKQPILTTQNTYYNNPEYNAKIKPPIKIKREPVPKVNIQDYLMELKKEIAISKEAQYDITKELFRD